MSLIVLYGMVVIKRNISNSQGGKKAALKLQLFSELYSTAIATARNSDDSNPVQKKDSQVYPEKCQNITARDHNSFLQNPYS